jgi:hypothetical protein
MTAEAIAKEKVARSVPEDLVGDIGIAYGNVLSLRTLHQ